MRISLKKLGIDNYTPKKYKYGVEMFIAGDEWLAYHHAKCTTNYKYTEFFANGHQYDSVAAYEANHYWRNMGLYAF